MLGNIASYAVNVNSADDAAAGLQFAQAKNIRLTVKNTGHDYLGRSTGEGSLALWIHNLKNISFSNYSSPQYTGPAVRLGAGVQAYEVYAAAADKGLRVTGGFCPTVGIVGGYVQGAGHGALEGLYGLAADNTLEFEVVTPDGRHLVTSPSQNSDLFWALNGGGGSTYAVVISQTTKAHLDGPVAGGSLSFNNTDDHAYWLAVEAWHERLLIFDNTTGFNSFWGVTNETFVVYSVILPGANASAMSAALDPFVQDLERLKLPHVYETNVKRNYYEHFTFYTADLPFGDYTTNSVLGGRLIQRSTVQRNLTDLISTFRNITRDSVHPFRINGVASNVTHARIGNSPGSNAVLPAWRDSLYWLNMDVYFDPAGPVGTILELQAHMNDNQNQLKVLTPGGGAYMNEGTFDDPDWKEDYYGANYETLLEVKKKFDPGFILYGPASVGSDFWKVASDGRLCKVN
ncbi:MAG: hypothetical protein M1821_006082 [Bathelium mastoideum]|nr:MAG: hypothetical protein M1821_006082 [Bathelium mastoideum]KAI9688386.1 MAG: hypothetical protein M1822_001335 [Bathelium mastoideum]